jgi:alkylation response protein AidB-like acyl-CoA dehydrogenase
MSENRTHLDPDESREMAEASRQTEWAAPSFAAELFMGRFRPELVHPFPEQDPADRAEGDAFLAELGAFLRERVDPVAIDRDEEVPDDVLRGLIDMGAFGMKIPREYGGLGLSQLNYNRAVALVASHCASTAVWLSAHQSIGVPQPIRLFGTEEQKKKFLPRLARGAISGFALTEPEVGSDPAAMATTAVPSEDGREWILNGEKLWCTNGLVAELLVVMARTPSKVVRGRERKQVTAFIVETDSPGFERVDRCLFLGIRAISNGLIRFRDVRVPAENVLGGEGRGLKIALETLNTGRLTLPAAGVGMARQCLQISRRWAGERVQWGAPIGKHEAVAAKLARMASHTFAMQALSDYASGLASRGGADIRLEAAFAKLFSSETALRIAEDAMQIRAGRGYEREESLARRGETPYPIERIYRDARINTLVEGTSEIMRLFIAREALDPHLKKAGALVNPRSSWKEKSRSLGSALRFYPGWYASLWFGLQEAAPAGVPSELGGHVRFVRRASRRLARGLFHAMIRVGPALERRQKLLGRFVDVGADLLAMSATISNAATGRGGGIAGNGPVELADHFCRCARQRIGDAFRGVRHNTDRADRAVARRVLEDRYGWLEEGIVVACPEETGDGSPVAEGEEAAAGDPVAGAGTAGAP